MILDVTVYPSRIGIDDGVVEYKWFPTACDMNLRVDRSRFRTVFARWIKYSLSNRMFYGAYEKERDDISRRSGEIVWLERK